MTALQSYKEQAQHYSAVRNRLFNTKPKPRPVVKALTPPVVKVDEPKAVAVKQKTEWFVFVPRPLWQCQDIYFDAHVIDSRCILDMLRSGEIELVNVGRRSIAQIVAEALKEFPKISVDQVRGVGRRREVVEARQTAMWILRQERPDLSFPQIGRWFGGRDHTTVLHAVRKIQAARDAA